MSDTVGYVGSEALLRNRWLTVDEAAAVLRRTPKAIRRLIERRRLPVVRSDRTRRILILTADLARYLGDGAIAGRTRR